MSAVVSASFDALWGELESIGRDPRTGGYRRFAWTETDALLREWFVGACAARGLELVEDRAGNQRGWWGDPDGVPGTAVVTGSHLDNVPDGGAYDGPLGVLSALAAIDALRVEGFRPRHPIGVVNFADEEGARFGVACVGSPLITGALTPERALGLVDADGISLAEARRRAQRRTDDLGPDPETVRRIGTFIELHVEQGRALVDLDAPLGVGREIGPHGRWRLDFTGEANHAGTTRLADRNDALLGCARLVLEARTAAQTYGCLATVGKITVEPGAVNAVPSAATAWLDARGPDEQSVRAAVAHLTNASTADDGRIAELSWTPATRFDANLAAELSARLGGAPVIGTGAGHDAGILSCAGAPSAMIFVRNPSGVSHAPAEFAEHDDCLVGVAALTHVLRDRAGAVA